MQTTCLEALHRSTRKFNLAKVRQDPSNNCLAKKLKQHGREGQPVKTDGYRSAS